MDWPGHPHGRYTVDSIGFSKTGNIRDSVRAALMSVGRPASRAELPGLEEAAVSQEKQSCHFQCVWSKSTQCEGLSTLFALHVSYWTVG